MGWLLCFFKSILFHKIKSYFILVRAVYRSGVLQSCEVERRIRLPNGYYLEVYALPMVMALAFRINTSNAARVRNVLLERLCLRKDRQMLWLSLGNSISCKC